MEGRIVQVNISPGGLPKRPVASGFITPLGLTGDGHVHPEIHGGPMQAILLVAAETIDELRTAGFPVFYGALGENLTTRGLDRREVRIGHQFRAGEAILEITKPRGPCSQLSVYGPDIQAAIYDSQVKARDFTSARWGMSGFYARVIQPGMVRTDDPVTLYSALA